MAEQQQQQGLYRKRIQPAATNVDDLVSRNALNALKRDPPPRPAPDHKAAGGASVEASDLISSMAKRLSGLERDMKERQTLLQQVQADNSALKGKLKVAEEEISRRALAAIDPKDDSAAVMHLRSENLRLRAQVKLAWKQVADMKNFLNDYGMVWVGDAEAEEQLAAATAAAGDAAPSPRSAAPPAPPPGAGRKLAAANATPLPAPPPEPAEHTAFRRVSHAGASGGPAPPAPAPGGGAGAARASAVGAARTSAAGAMRTSTTGSVAAAAALTPEASGSDVASVGKRSGSFTQQPQRLAPLPASASAASSPTSAARGGFGAHAGPPVSMAQLRSKLDELNDVAGDGCGQLVKNGGGQHVLAMPKAVHMVVYRDALQIHDMPPKPYSDSAVQAVLRDILDGYFPYVLKRDFPDGVPIRLVDRSSEAAPEAASPLGAVPGAAGLPPRPAGNIRSFMDIDATPGASGSAGAGGSIPVPEPLSRERFLGRLPQAVIKNGKVIEIKSEIGKMLDGGLPGGGGGPAKPDVVSTPVDALLSTMQRNHVGPSLPPPSREGAPAAPAEVATLQVKNEDGQQTFILKLKYDDNIGSLRACIDTHRAKLKPPADKGYEIRSAFPARTYTDAAETLRAAGLIPNATLFLRALH